MALIIPTFKQGNKTTENAYAKVSRVQVDNDTNRASFGTSIYKSKEDRTRLASIRQIQFDILDDVDIVEQCYNALHSKVSEVESSIAELQAKVDADVQHKDRKAIWDLSVLKADTVLALKGSIDDI